MLAALANQLDPGGEPIHGVCPMSEGDSAVPQLSLGSSIWDCGDDRGSWSAEGWPCSWPLALAKMLDWLGWRDMEAACVRLMNLLDLVSSLV